MPLNEYICPKQHTIEVIQKFSDPPLEVCPTCGEPLKKTLHPSLIKGFFRWYKPSDYGDGIAYGAYHT